VGGATIAAGEGTGAAGGGGGGMGAGRAPGAAGAGAGGGAGASSAWASPVVAAPYAAKVNASSEGNRKPLRPIGPLPLAF
jgi:hypothetical protein